MQPQQNIRESLDKALLVSCLGLIAFWASTLPSPAVPPGYTLQWSDEFTGNSLNTSNWEYARNGWRNSAYNTSAAVSVANGCLVITTYTEGGTNFTGFIDTQNKISNSYGYYEASIQFSNAPGQWSAFWLQTPWMMNVQPDGTLGNPNTNPTNGVEIDIFEHRCVDADGNSWIDGGDNALWWDGYGPSEQGATWTSQNLGVTTGFHTYGLLWTPSSYIFYVDGNVTWTTSSYLISSTQQFIRLTSEVQDASWAGNVPAGGYPNKSTSQVKMLVDYVRYYRPPIPPSIVTQPTNTLASQFGTATFYAAAEGTPPLSYQWYDQNNEAIRGATNSMLVLSNLSSSASGNSYYAVAISSYGLSQSGAATLTVVSGAPQIYGNLQSQCFVSGGGTISIPLAVYGTMPLSCRWQRSDTNAVNWTNLTDNGRITGSQSNVLTIAYAQPSDAGDYQMIITNAVGSTSSGVASLIVGSPRLSLNGAGLGWTAGGSAGITNNLLSLTDPNNGGGDGSCFFQYPQYVGAFKASFTYQAGGNKAADGVTFCLQNDPRGSSARGSNGGNLGVGGTSAITPSIELELNIYNSSKEIRGYTVLTNGLTGVGGANGNYHAIGSVSLDSGDPVAVTVLYSNRQMALTFTDATANTSFSTNLNVGNLTNIVGGNTAYVGFTGGYGGSTSVQTISNFSFVSIPSAAIQLSGTNALISWPGVTGGYVLQQNADLTTTNWVNVTKPSIVTNGQNQVTLPVGGSNLFFRLMLP